MRLEHIGAFEEHVSVQIFATLGTCNRKAAPHNSPKIILKLQRPHLYLIEYHRGTSFRNIEENPAVSVSTFNLRKMTGFHLEGEAEILTEGAAFQRLMAELRERQIRLSTHEVVEAVRGNPGTQLKRFIGLTPAAVYKITLAGISPIRAFDRSFLE